MEREVVLLDFWPSPYAMRVRIALAEKGIEYESMEEDLLQSKNKNKNKSSLLLKMNPIHKQVPVLIHNGRPVCESFIILEYIDEVWTHQPPLFPSHPSELAHVRFLADIVDNKVYVAWRKVWRAKGEEQKDAREELIWGLKFLESELGGKTYFGGERFGVLDVMLVPIYSWSHALEVFGRVSLVEECPKIIKTSIWCRWLTLLSPPNSLIYYNFFIFIFHISICFDLIYLYLWQMAFLSPPTV